METATHYATLGLSQSAELPVIRAAYRALALNHHPDKTLHLSAEDRAQHSALFVRIQEAFDCLNNPSLKAAYDRELERHGSRVDLERSTFHHPSTPSTTPRRRNTIRLTSPEEKRACKAKLEQDLAYLREQRAKRDMEDSQMDIGGLKFMLQTWTELALEYDDDALGHGDLHAHSLVQVQIYQAKIAQREREHRDWLEGMSRPKTPGAPSAKSCHPAPSGTPTSTRFNLRTAPRAVPKKPTATATATPTRFTQTEDKTRKGAAKQAQLDAKAAAVRVEKEKRKAALEEHARQEAARKTRARAKAGAPALGQWGAGVKSYTNNTARENARKANSTQKLCSTCGAEHASFAEFRTCIKERAKGEDDESFFHIV